MKIYIPALGDILVIEKNWTFDLHLEYRNSTAWEKWTDKKESPSWNVTKTAKVTLKKGDRLVVDRIYIKKGSPAYNSVTFRHYSEGTTKGSTRFWAKLHDVNTLEAAPLIVEIKEIKKK